MKHIFLLLCCGLFMHTVSAAPDKDAVLNGQSEGGQTKLIIHILNGNGAISLAQVITGRDTVEFDSDCDAYSVIELPNHLFTLCMQQRGTAPGTAGVKSMRLWAIPGSFVRMASNNDYSWRFKAKLDYPAPAKSPAEFIKLDCTIVYHP